MCVLRLYLGSRLYPHREVLVRCLRRQLQCQLMFRSRDLHSTDDPPRVPMTKWRPLLVVALGSPEMFSMQVLLLIVTTAPHPSTLDRSLGRWPEGGPTLWDAVHLRRHVLLTDKRSWHMQGLRQERPVQLHD
jgi:hypothetical protein